MAEDEIRRRKTNDREMDAIIVITQALADLDRVAAARVLEWARQRFVEADTLMPLEAMKAGTNFIEGINTIAKRLGGTDPLKVLRAMERVVGELDKEEPDVVT